MSSEYNCAAKAAACQAHYLQMCKFNTVYSVVSLLTIDFFKHMSPLSVIILFLLVLSFFFLLIITVKVLILF